MKRFLILIALSTVAIHAQESEAGAKHEEGGKKEIPHEMAWKWANFAILAAGLGYLAAKHGGPFFKSRTEEIRKGIAEAAKLKQEADTKAAEMERRMGALETEIDSLKATAQTEMTAAGERLRAETAAQIAKIQAQAEQDIEIAGKVAIRDLKSYAAELAINLAEQKIRAGMSDGVQDKLIQNFVHNVAAGGGKN